MEVPLTALAGAHVARARVRARGDPLVVRLRAEAGLAAADWHVPGLRPAAILVIRSLADPLPGGLELAGALVPPRWAAALRNALQRAAAGAARPAAGPVALDAAAVVFADRAELLACLARDAAAGLVRERWWWRTLLSGRSPSVLWDDAAEAVPAAVELLARWRCTAALGFLTPAAAQRCAYAALAWHGRTVAEPGPAGGPPAAAVRRLLAAAPECAAPGLAPEQRALLGVALVLRRAPATDDSTLAAAMEAWRHEGVVAPAPGARATASITPAPRAQKAGRAAEAGPAVRGPAPEPREPPDARRAAARRSQAPARGAPARRERAAARTVRAARPRPARTEAPSAGRARPPLIKRGARHEPAPRALGLPESPAAADTLELLAADSALAGALFLLNVGLHLGLYGDASRPRDRGPGLDPFDFVQLLAARLDARARRPDPLWRLLARLAGREAGERPGRGFRPPGAWRVSPAWVEPFGFDGPWPIAVARERLTARHPAGFTVLDVPLRGPREDARAARRRWLGHLAGYVAARLELALGVPEAGRLLVRLPGRVEATAARLDASFALADLPIPIRRAGLDRTPGWIPACGRHVAFHFA